MLQQYNSLKVASFGLMLFLASSLVASVYGQRPTSSSELLLKPEHGPWMVLAASFEGEGAKRKAVQLAAELREDFRLKAYCLPKMFDYTQKVTGLGFTPDGEQKKMKYQDNRVVESCAVLIGDFDSIEGDDIARTLNLVRTIKPKFFMQSGTESSAGDSTKVAAGDYRKFLQKLVVRNEEPKIKDPGPMAKGAFLVRNPLLPAEYFKSPTVDKFVKDLNQQPLLKEYNLLTCKNNFTVRVITFRGNSSYVSWGRSTAPEDARSELEAAAEQAYLVTKVLRGAGYEAYQFHDRHESIVTIGGFDQLGKEDQDKNFTYDPAIQKVVDRFKGTDRVTQSQFGVTQTPRLLFELVDQNRIPELTKGTRKEQLELFRKLSVAFDLIPLPISVPKLEAKTLYSGYALGK
jgi:hypothetical protein